MLVGIDFDVINKSQSFQDLLEWRKCQGQAGWYGVLAIVTGKCKVIKILIIILIIITIIILKSAFLFNVNAQEQIKFTVQDASLLLLNKFHHNIVKVTVNPQAIAWANGSTDNFVIAMIKSMNNTRTELNNNYFFSNDANRNGQTLCREGRECT